MTLLSQYPGPITPPPLRHRPGTMPTTASTPDPPSPSPLPIMPQSLQLSHLRSRSPPAKTRTRCTDPHDPAYDAAPANAQGRIPLVISLPHPVPPNTPPADLAPAVASVSALATPRRHSTPTTAAVSVGSDTSCRDCFPHTSTELCTCHSRICTGITLAVSFLSLLYRPKSRIKYSPPLHAL
jgi:hypothetical protein